MAKRTSIWSTAIALRRQSLIQSELLSFSVARMEPLTLYTKQRPCPVVRSLAVPLLTSNTHEVQFLSLYPVPGSETRDSKIQVKRMKIDFRVNGTHLYHLTREFTAEVSVEQGAMIAVPIKKDELQKAKELRSSNSAGGKWSDSARRGALV